MVFCSLLTGGYLECRWKGVMTAKGLPNPTRGLLIIEHTWALEDRYSIFILRTAIEGQYASLDLIVSFTVDGMKGQEILLPVECVGACESRPRSIYIEKNVRNLLETLGQAGQAGQFQD
jgi:hypothetical protein